MGFSRQEYWRGLPFPSSGDHSHPGIKSGSSALQADSIPSGLPRKPVGDLAKSSLRIRALKPRHLACRHLARTTLGEVEGPWAGIHTASRHKQNLGAWHHMITHRPVLTVQMRLRMSGGHGRPLSCFSKTRAPGQYPSTGSLSTLHKCIFCLPRCV